MSSIKLTADSGGGTFEIKAPSSSGNTRVLTLPDTANLTLGATGILQFKVAQKNDTASSAATQMTEISSDLRVTLTPISATSLIVIQAQLSYMSYGNYGCAAMIRKNTASDFSGTTSNVYQLSLIHI